MEHMGLASTDKSLKLKVHDKDINKILRRSHRLPRLYQKMYGNMRTAMTCLWRNLQKEYGKFPWLSIGGFFAVAHMIQDKVNEILNLPSVRISYKHINKKRVQSKELKQFWFVLSFFPGVKRF